MTSTLVGSVRCSAFSVQCRSTYKDTVHSSGVGCNTYIHPPPFELDWTFDPNASPIIVSCGNRPNLPWREQGAPGSWSLVSARQAGVSPLGWVGMAATACLSVILCENRLDLPVAVVRSFSNHNRLDHSCLHALHPAYMTCGEDRRGVVNDTAMQSTMTETGAMHVPISYNAPVTTS